MKAKGYYKKYGPKFKACIPKEEWEKFRGDAYGYAGLYPQYITLLKELQAEFGKDQQELLHSIKPETPEGLLNIIKDVNRKWNALNRIFEDKQGGSPINKDGWGRLMGIRIAAQVGPTKPKEDNAESNPQYADNTKYVDLGPAKEDESDGNA